MYLRSFIFIFQFLMFPVLHSYRFYVLYDYYFRIVSLSVKCNLNLVSKIQISGFTSEYSFLYCMIRSGSDAVSLLVCCSFIHLFVIASRGLAYSGPQR